MTEQFTDGALKVYIAVMRFPQAPEPGAWVVAYAPGTRVAERARARLIALFSARACLGSACSNASA